MRHTHSLMLVFALGLMACGPDEQPVDDGAVTPPERPERPTQAIDELEERENNPIIADVESDIPDATFEAEEPLECCELEFALPDSERDPDEVSAFLFGTASPLDVEGGLEMTYSEGAWRVTACVPPNYDGFYHYVVNIADENGDVVFESHRVNPFVDTGLSDIGEINLWNAGQTCDEAEVERHSALR